MKKLTNFNILLLFVAIFLLGFQAKATLVPVTVGKFYTPHGSTPTNVVGSSYSKYSYAQSNPVSPDFDLLKKGVIELGIDHHHTSYVAEHHTEVSISIRKWTTLGPDTTSTAQTATLVIDYKPNSELSFNDAELLEITDVLKYKVTITSITVNGTSQNTLPANVFLELGLVVNRLYDFTSEVSGTVALDDFDSGKLIDKDCDGINDELLIEWTKLDGAEEYQLEWTFVNDYTAGTGYKPASSVEFDFKRNSTRILTVDDHYSISLIYPHGYLIYRIRAVGRLASAPTKRVYTQWSSPEVGTVAANANDYYLNTHEWEVAKNWQYTATFAEEGKRKEVVSFFDGTLRSRQMVTVMNSVSNNRAIVGETIYDHVGRPAVQVLPAPMLTTACTTGVVQGTLKYYKDFNLNETAQAYSKIDISSGAECEVGVAPMKVTAGASKYYSGSNTDIADVQAYVPDAGKYPFSQTQYTPDNTGRIKRQGGVGTTFQLSGNHATDYFYAHPSQLELDRMFGSEVGDATHYQKNMVTDANGQVSVSYLDQEGRVIATALAGEVPSNLLALESQAGAQVSMDESLFGAGTNGNVLGEDGMSKVYNAVVSVSAVTDMTFNYDISVNKFDDPCFAETVCFDCVYDLTISVTDDCGASMIPSGSNLNGLLVGRYTEIGDSIIFSVSCTNSSINNGSKTFTIPSMPIGTYQVTKTLSVNQEALAFYEAAYMDSTKNTCFKSLSDFQQEYLAAADYSGCEEDPSDCAACVASLGTEANFIANGYGTSAEYAQLVADCNMPCSPRSMASAIRTMMLNDVSPGGQYGEYLTNGSVFPQNFPLSVYNVSNQLPPSHYASPMTGWQQPNYFNGTSFVAKYYEEDLVTESKVQLFNVVLNSVGNIISSEPVILNGTIGNFSYDLSTDTYWTVAQNLSNVSDFIQEFKPSWAHSLLYYHPEYYYLKTYLELEKDFSGTSSESFDYKMEHANTWQEAIDAKLIKSNYASISTVKDRLEDYTSIPTPATAHAFDPFVESTSASLMGWNTYNGAFTSKLNSYQTISSVAYHATQIAAMISRCSTPGSSSPASTCYRFGDNASGSGAGGTSAADIAARDADWVNFKSIYRSLKQQYLFAMAEDRAINNGSYRGYNACIGNTNFDPTDNGFLTSMGGQFINDDQPCFVGTMNLYKYKVRRFIKPGSSILNSGDMISTTDPYDGLEEAESVAYQLTGNCPVSISLANLVNDLIEDKHHDDASYVLKNSEDFIGYLLSQRQITPPIDTLPSWTWNATVSGATLDIDIKDGSTLLEEIVFVQQGTPISWASVPTMVDFKATGTGGYGYTFSARFIVAGDTTEILGSTSIDILNCSFSPSCSLNSLGNDLRNLMNVMVGSNLMSTTPVTILGGSSIPPVNQMVTPELLNTLNPLTNPSTVTWVYNTTEGAIDIYGGSGKKIRLDVVSAVPSSFTPSSITSFPIVDVLDDNTMKIYAYNGSSLYVTFTVDAQLVKPGSPDTVTNLAIGSCAVNSITCDDQAIVNVGELKLLLNDVLKNQTGATPGYDLYNSPYMTANLSGQFQYGTTSTVSSTTAFSECNDGYVEGTEVISQTVSIVGGITQKTITIYQTVTPTSVITYRDSTLCNLDGLTGCRTWTTTLSTEARICATINQTTIAIGKCDLILKMDDALGDLDDIIEVLELIPSGPTDAIGNYHAFDLVVQLPSSVVDTVSGSICLALRLCESTDPINFPDIDLPIDSFINPCNVMVTNLALANAQNAYDAYVDSLLTEFRAAYISHCMGAVETFTRQYIQREYHHTLYYYDQAGNLIKTVPPEGVELLPITSSTDALSVSIANDRLNGTQTVKTSHRMETRYLYNSLNQLIAQHMPDMDDMSSWSQTLPNGLDAKLNTTGIQMLDAANGYLTGYVTSTNSPSGMRGYLYKTTNGGVNWTRETGLFPFDLVRVRMASSTVGFAVGKSGVALRTMDGGSTWDLLDMHSKGVVGDFVDVAVQDASNAAFLLSTGQIVRYYSGGTLGNLYTPAVPSSVTGTPILRAGNSITYNGSSNVYIVNLEFVEGTSPDTLRFTQMGLVNVATPSISYQTINGSQWNAISYVNNTLGVVAGPDGDVLFLNDNTTTLPGTGNGTAFLQSSDLIGNIIDIAFLDKKAGVALVDNSGTKSFYRTFNGGLNWEKVISTAASCMNVVSQTSSDLYIVVSYNDNYVRYYDLTSTAITLKWQHNAGYIFDKITTLPLLFSNYGYWGITSGLSTYLASSFTLTGGTAPSSLIAINTFSTGTSAISLKAIIASGKYHFVANMSSGVVLDYSDASGVLTEHTISPAGASFKNIVLGSNGGSFILGYDNATQKLYRTLLTNSVPATMGVISNTISGGNISSLAIHNNYVSVVSTAGKLMYSSATISATSGTILGWTDRSNIRVIPIRSSSVISYANNSVNYNAIAVGDRAMGLRRTTGNIWTVYPLGLSSTMLLGDPSITPQLKSVATATVSATNYAILVGEQATRIRLNLNTGAKSTLSSSEIYFSGSAPMFTDAAINTSGNTVLTSANGKAFYRADINSGTSFTLINCGVGSLYGASLIPGGTSPFNAILVGVNGAVGTLTSTTFTRTTGVFGPRLNSVHFAPTVNSRGTVVGDNFFVRSTSNAGTSWSRVLPASPIAANLIKNVTDVWTRPLAASINYAVLGGPSLLSYSLGNVATPDAFNGSIAINDIQFNVAGDTNIGYLANNTSLKKIVLSPSGGSYTAAITSPLSAALSTSINAIHIFNNNSTNTSEMMLVGNNMIQYKAEGATTTINLLAGVTGNIRDVYFTDRTHGYVAGDGGLFYKTDNITYNTSGTAYTAMSWQQVDISDAYTGTLSNINVQAIAFPSVTQGVWGGNYTTDPGAAYPAVRILGMQDQIYSSRFYYDRLGRIVVSQNSRQKGQNKYSYTLYDGLGRVVEAGEKTENTAGGGATFFASIFGTSVGGQYIGSVIDDAKLNTWITTQSGTTRKEVTRSFYDKTNTNINSNGLSTYDAAFFNIATQRKRIVHVTYEETFDVDGSGNPVDGTYDHATHYNYDIHGNVTTMLQDNKLLGALTSLSAQRFKKMSYIFDLISGNVHRVDYQTGKADQWHHYYEYDADNRIMEAYTTKATPLADPAYGMLEVLVEPTISPYWQREASYQYYDHGPLARTVIGNEEVQGLDYVYTLQGWIKSVNSNALDVTYDPGKDGTSGNNHAVARDVMGYSLHYYDGDYSSISGASSFIATQGSSSDIFTNSRDLYNGNIGRMVTTITDPNSRAILPLGNAYKYDQLNRLKEAVSFTNLTSNNWGAGGTGIYQNTFGYDANGNIKTQVRKNNSGTTIDDLKYAYQQNSANKTVRNRLYHVDDNVNSVTFTDDIDDMGNFVGNGTINTANNYSYDAEGRLIKDSQEQIASIEWRVDGKVKAINRTNGSIKKNLKFDYDAMGHRIAKHVYDNSTAALEISTYYILDAQGNTISTYERKILTSSVEFYQNERYIYGSSRLGVMTEKINLYASAGTDPYSQTTWNDTIGKRTYELTNHLGNVLSVISDKVIPHPNGSGGVDYFLADIRQSTDYSAFGVQLENRTLTLTGVTKKYKNGFNGELQDDEVKGSGNSYDYGNRFYDSRVGKFLSLDAYAIKYPSISPYSFALNSPLKNKDIGGDSVLFYSASGDYLGFSHDNERYKDQNLLVIIKDNDVSAFNKQYQTKKHLPDSEIPKERKTDASKKAYREALVAGLEGMGTTYDVTAMSKFRDEYKTKTTHNGVVVEQSSMPDEYTKETEFGVFFERVKNPIVKGKNNFIVPNLKEVAIGGFDDTHWEDIMELDAREGSIHTHTSRLSLYPSAGIDWARQRKLNVQNPEAFSVIGQETNLLFFRKIILEGGDDNVTIEVKKDSFKNAK